MVGAFKKLVPDHRSKPQYLMVEGVGGKTRINPGDANSLHGVPLLENFDAVEHPAEPMELDNPARCPPPENSILQDGLVWRARVARSFQRRPMVRTSTWQGGHGYAVRLAGAVSSPGLETRPGSSSSGGSHHQGKRMSLFVTQSAPESAVSHMLV